MLPSAKSSVSASQSKNVLGAQWRQAVGFDGVGLFQELFQNPHSQSSDHL